MVIPYGGRNSGCRNFELIPPRLTYCERFMRYDVVFFIDKRCFHDCQTVTLGVFMSIKSRYSMLPIVETCRNECNVGDLGILIPEASFDPWLLCIHCKKTVGKSFSNREYVLAIPEKIFSRPHPSFAQYFVLQLHLSSIGEKHGSPNHR